MCGIAGFYGLPLKFNKDTIESTLELMKRRGPDSLNSYEDLNFLLLHSRLSIIDLSDNSNQPFVHYPYVFGYNGELYNHKEIMQHSKSDGRMMFSCLTGNYGLKWLEEFDGMWAFALYNAKENELILCRDRYGEKPLYIYETDDGVFFGSQINFIASLAKKKFDINYSLLSRYLFCGYRSLFKNPSETFFRNIRAVKPGYYYRYRVVWNKVVCTEYKYWPRNIDEKFLCTTDKAVNAIEEELKYAVKTRLRSDVPLAFCMSGGVDSNSLITVAKKVFNYNVHGYTIANEDKRYNESAIVNRVIDRLEIKHTYVPIKLENFESDLKEIVKNHSSPLVSVSYYLHFLLLKKMKEDGYKVSVAGTAGDEFFSGYYDHFLYHIASLYPYDAKDRRLWLNNVKPFIRNPIFKEADLFIKTPYYRSYLYFDNEIRKMNLFNNEYHWEKSYSYSKILKNRMLNELFHETVPPILHDDDLNSMYWSIENRSPFLTPKMYQILMNVDEELLIQEATGKFLLRTALKRIAPEVESIIPVKKTGFNCSFFDLMPNWKDFLSHESILWEIVNRDMFETFDFTNEEHSKFLFNMVNAKAFLDEFN